MPFTGGAPPIKPIRCNPVSLRRGRLDCSVAYFGHLDSFISADAPAACDTDAGPEHGDFPQQGQLGASVGGGRDRQASTGKSQ